MRLAALATLRGRVQLLLIITLLPALGLMLWNAYTARNREREEVQQQAFQVVTVAALAQQQMLDSIGQMLGLVGGTAIDNSTAPCGGVMDAARTFPGIANVGLATADGRLVCTIRPGAALSPSAAHWLRAAAAQPHVAISAFQPQALGPAPAIIVARRGAGGVVFATLDLDRITATLQAIPLPADSSINVIDAGGTIVARFPEHDRFVGQAATALVAQGVLQGDGVLEAVGVDGRLRLYGVRSVRVGEARPLVLTVGIPTTVAYAAANRRLQVGLAVLAAVAAVAYVFARRLSIELFGRKIESVMRAARRVSAGDLSARTGETWTDDELGELARAFDAMAWTLDERTRDLQQSVDSLRALTARLETVREEERTRISREIHDELGQVLTGIRMDLDRLEERVRAAALPDAAADSLLAKLASARTLVDAGSETARRVSRQLRPSVLDVLGFRAAVEWQLDEFKMRSGLDAELIADDNLPELPEQQSVALFRILQETLTNVTRHAHATAVTVRLAREEGGYTLEVMDNGRGFDLPATSAVPHSLGLLGMRERAASIGGRMDVTSAPGHGTTVTVTIAAPAGGHGQRS